MSSNRAAYLTARGRPLEIKEAPYTRPADNEIVIRNRAVALNPVDCYMQAMGDSFFPWIKIPSIIGVDLAGEVVEVGSGVTRLQPGDRVLGMGVGTVEGFAQSESAFQVYTVVKSQVAALIPDDMTFENAAVIPLGVSTAASGLFQKDYLNLQHPSIPAREPTGQALLIWGGATSVGCNAIQLVAAAGYEVITTCSPKNFSFVKSLGASQIFDYNSPSVVTDIVSALEGKTIAGALAITSGSDTPCSEIVLKCTGRKFLACGLPVSADKIPEGVEAKFIQGNSLMDNEVGPMIFEQFLPRALEQGTYKAVPEPKVVGKGLESINEGLTFLSKGVSATKVVVSL